MPNTSTLPASHDRFLEIIGATRGYSPYLLWEYEIPEWHPYTEGISI